MIYIIPSPWEHSRTTLRWDTKFRSVYFYCYEIFEMPTMESDSRRLLYYGYDSAADLWNFIPNTGLVGVRDVISIWQLFVTVSFRCKAPGSETPLEAVDSFCAATNTNWYPPFYSVLSYCVCPKPTCCCTGPWFVGPVNPTLFLECTSRLTLNRISWPPPYSAMEQMTEE